jgi:phosphoglycerate kinase
MINDAKTIIWNGTLGMVEDPRFAHSSMAIAMEMGISNATTIVGGGDTTGFVESVLKDNPDLKYTLVSTGGGASLELLSGKKLPGLEVLRNS